MGERGKRGRDKRGLGVEGETVVNFVSIVKDILIQKIENILS